MKKVIFVVLVIGLVMMSMAGAGADDGESVTCPPTPTLPPLAIDLANFEVVNYGGGDVTEPVSRDMGSAVAAVVFLGSLTLLVYGLRRM